VRAIERELAKFDAGLMDKPRWLLLNKADLLTREDAQAQAEMVIGELGWTGPWFIVSGLAHDGTREVMVRVQAFLDELVRDEREAAAAGTDAPGA
jgi:GTP-binding protein